MKKRNKLFKNKIFNTFLVSTIIALPVLSTISCGKKTWKRREVFDKETTIKIKYNNHSYSINYYEEKPEANKPEILFLHGLGANKTEFDPLFEMKDRNYTMITLDYPGTPGGKSSYDPEKDEKISTQMYAGIVQEFVKIQGPENLVLFGHSLSGGIIPQVMVNKDHKIKKGLLLAPFNPYTLSSFMELLNTSTDEEKKAATDITQTLNQLDQMKNNKSKTPDEVLNTLYESLKNIYDDASKNYNSFPHFLNIRWITDLVNMVKLDKNHLNYNMLVNELLSRKFASGTLLNAFKATKDKLVCISGEGDTVIPIQSTEKMASELKIPLSKQDINFPHSPSVRGDKESSRAKKWWNIVEQFIDDQIKDL